MVADAPVVYTDETDIASRIIDFVSERDTLRASEVFERNWEVTPISQVRRLSASGR